MTTGLDCATSSTWHFGVFVVVVVINFPGPWSVWRAHWYSRCTRPKGKQVQAKTRKRQVSLGVWLQGLEGKFTLGFGWSYLWTKFSTSTKSDLTISFVARCFFFKFHNLGVLLERVVSFLPSADKTCCRTVTVPTQRAFQVALSRRDGSK